MTDGEKDALRVAVQQCWNVGSLSTDALQTTVIVQVSMSQDGRPDTGSIRMVGFEGGSEAAAQQAYEAARRAIIRCGANGFALPVEKYDQWRDIEMVFNPERMRNQMMGWRLLAAALFGLFAVTAHAQQGPLRIEIMEGVIEPLPFAIPEFQAETADAAQYARDITRVVAADLVGTGLFREIAPGSFVSTVTSFDAPVAFPDWRAINAQALVTGAVSVSGDGRIVVKFRLFDMFAGQPLGEGLQFVGDPGSWRRMAHKVADQVYCRITGEGGYFDSRVVFVAESGPKDARVKRLAVMDYDGANIQYLTDGSAS